MRDVSRWFGHVLQARGHWFEPSCAHQVRGYVGPVGGEPSGGPGWLSLADASVRRRGHGEDAICFAADKNRYIGAVSVGFGPDGKRLRRKISGEAKEVRDKLKAVQSEAQRWAAVVGGIHGPSGGGLAGAWAVGPGRCGRFSCTGRA